ncbi:MAG TPA: ABC transporter permease, partial [Candidatus Krumholzibacterium sp.]|nr:ABC transporter permease [Candidatus Krumholzibacterium sp.]
MARKRKSAKTDQPHEWLSPPPFACRLMARFTRAVDASLCGGRSALDGSGSALYGDLTAYGALGDLEERYNRIASKSGKPRADSWYWSQVAFAFPGFLTNLIYWSVIMFRNYFKVTIRNIARHKWYSTINILGLAMGITACVLILLWVQDELSYDRMYPEAKRVYRVYRYLDRPGGVSVSSVSPAGLAPMLESDYPGVEKAARLMTHNFVLGYEDRRFNELIALADPQLIDILSIKFLRGDPATALSELDYIVITRELAEKYFGDEDPIGKGLQVETWYTATVMGVIENRPEKTTVRHFDALINFNIYAPLWRRDLSDLAVGNYNTYLMTAPES